MAADVQGTAHYRGIGATIANATIVAVDLERLYGVEDAVKSETDVTISTHRDDRRNEGTVRLRIQSGYTIPALGDTLALSGLRNTVFNSTYEITKIGHAEQAGAYVEVTFTVVKHEAFTPS